jgi:putative PIN family toxin of toxin-antitoxin system
MSDLRVVFDSNVIVSAVLLRTSSARKSVDLGRTQGKILVSSATIVELEDVLRRPKFDRYISESERIEFLSALVELAEYVIVADQVAVCRDPHDDKYLELAVSGAATHIDSGDQDLLALHPFRGIPILTPQAFMTSRVG